MMSGSKFIDVELDDASWVGGVPLAIAGLRGRQQIDLRDALLRLGVLTRPPVLRGFHLCDVAAFMRYGAAFHPSPELRLRQEWSELDPHQKTILSDEVGVGVTCKLLGAALGLAEIVQTSFFLRAIEPNSFRLGGDSRIGSRKIPDYIGWSSSTANVTVIECKGTQTPGYLRRQIRAGEAQKRNVVTDGGIVGHSVVAGLFISQVGLRQPSEVLIMDPPIGVLNAVLERHRPGSVVAAIRQVWLAKMFAFLGWSQEANLLAERPSLEWSEEEFISLLRRRLDGGRLERTIEPQLKLDSDQKAALLPRSLRISANPHRLRSMTERDSLRHILTSVEPEEDVGWRFRSLGDQARLRVPFGFEFVLDAEVRGEWVE